MKVCARRFNIYFTLAAVLALLCGCKTGQQREQEKTKDVVGALRVHIEAGAGDAGSTQTISVLRSDPVLVTIVDEPILTEASLIAAKVIDTPGGFAIEVKFDEISASLLEQYTAENPGRHLVIFGQWGDKLANGRWLAAPLITHRISDGTLAFTPDMSRKEADQLVLGLNNVAAKINKGSFK
jgi:SecDF, P1 head subdomain